jgi:HAE1 family hydrophobic/amphiphilic exporter-1
VKLLSIGLLTLAAARVYATDARPQHALSLDEALTRALQRNYTIAIERDAYAGALQRVRSEEGAYDFQLSLDAGYGEHTDPVNSLLSGAPAGKVAPELRTFDFNLALSRLLPTGARVSAFGAGARDASDGTFALLSPAYSSSLGVELRQPLLRDRAIDPVRRSIRVARSDKERSLGALKRTIVEILAAVDGAYWNLTAVQRGVDVRQAALGLAEQQLSESRARISVGTLPATEEAQPRAELERRKGELLEAQELAVRAENALKALMLDEGQDPLWLERLVPSDRALAEHKPVDVISALTAALELRPEVDQAKAAVAARETDVQAARDERKPRLDAVAAYARRGLSGSLNPNAAGFPGQAVVVPPDLSGGAGRSLGTLGDGLYPDWRLGLSFSIPIGNRTAKAKLAIAEADARQAATDLLRVRQTVRVEVLNAVAGVETTAERTDATLAAREAAEVQLRSEQERFAVGMSTNFLVLTRQNDLSRARLDEIEALADHRKALTELQRASGRLLQERGVVVAEGGTK